MPYRLAIPQYLVPGAGLEPARLSTMDFESTASAYSAIWAQSAGNRIRLRGMCEQ